MSSPDRTGGVGSPGWAPSAAIPGPPVPPAGAAGDASPPAPAGPQTTVGAVAPETSAAPAVFQVRWGTALSGRRAHLVADGAAQDVHVGRLIGFTVDGWWALIDPRSLVEAAGEEMPKCLGCATMLKQMGPRVVVVSP